LLSRRKIALFLQVTSDRRQNLIDFAYGSSQLGFALLGTCLKHAVFLSHYITIVVVSIPYRQGCDGQQNQGNEGPNGNSNENLLWNALHICPSDLDIFVRSVCKVLPDLCRERLPNVVLWQLFGLICVNYAQNPPLATALSVHRRAGGAMTQSGTCGTVIPVRYVDFRDQQPVKV
jgi:hypothetical protein